jgi:hypothetical protein
MSCCSREFSANDAEREHHKLVSMNALRGNWAPIHAFLGVSLRSESYTSTLRALRGRSVCVLDKPQHQRAALSVSAANSNHALTGANAQHDALEANTAAEAAPYRANAIAERSARPLALRQAAVQLLRDSDLVCRHTLLRLRAHTRSCNSTRAHTEHAACSAQQTLCRFRCLAQAAVSCTNLLERPTARSKQQENGHVVVTALSRTHA